LSGRWWVRDIEGKLLKKFVLCILFPAAWAQGFFSRPCNGPPADDMNRLYEEVSRTVARETGNVQ